MGIESLLFGLAASAPAAGAAGATAAATTGLLGAGGVFSLGTTLGTLGTIASGLGALSSISGGITGQREASQQSEYALAEAAMAGKESSRQASEQAIQEREAYKDIKQRQKLAYMKSGVTLEGSPLLVMEETRRKGESNIDEILSYGASSYASQITQGVNAAKKAKSLGRQQLTQGITGSIGGLSNVLGAFA